MSAYQLDDERAIRTSRLVDDWTRSGLLTAAQREVITPQLAVELRRTNLFLRITLFLFGGVILQSALGLLAIAFGGLADATAMGVLSLVVGGGCFWLSSQLVGRYHLYRFGVEEVIALSAAGLVAGGAALVVIDAGGSPVVTGLVLAIVALAGLFVHFGYVYAALMAMAAAAAVPFQLPWLALEAGGSESLQRVVAIAVLAACAIGARRARAPHGGEYPGDALAVIEAGAWLGIYLLLNVVVSSGFSRVERASASYWTTYAAIWAAPAIGLVLALRGRERPLLLVSLAMALTTLLTNKAYLGSRRYEWDPIVFGLFLMGVAIAVRRWLASGEGGQRYGYTASRLVASDSANLGHLAIVSAAHADVPVAPSSTPSDPAIGGGGRSGGAGAGGSF